MEEQRFQFQMELSGAAALWEGLTYQLCAMTTMSRFEQPKQHLTPNPRMPMPERKQWAEVSGNPTTLGMIALTFGVPIGSNVYLGDNRKIVAAFLVEWAKCLAQDIPHIPQPEQEEDNTPADEQEPEGC